MVLHAAGGLVCGPLLLEARFCVGGGGGSASVTVTFINGLVSDAAAVSSIDTMAWLDPLGCTAQRMRSGGARGFFSL